MIGLDTNVLVRYLAQDDAIQSPHATRIIERQLTGERPGFISLVTMVETVWVLDRVYRLSKYEIAAAVERILQADTLLLQNEQGSLHRHDRSQNRSRVLFGRAHWRARRVGGMRGYPYLRPKGEATEAIQASLGLREGPPIPFWRAFPWTANFRSRVVQEQPGRKLRFQVNYYATNRR